MTFILIAAAVAFAIYLMAKGSNSAAVPVPAAELGTDGQIDAIEYFWRPG